jgi:hypothetical protein
MTNNDEMINQKQLHLNDIKQQLDDIHQKFIQETADFLKESYLKYAKIQFQKENDIAFSLEDKAKELKSKVENLSNNTLKIAEKCLSTSNLGDSRETNQAVDSAFVVLEDVLKEYGFLNDYSNPDCPFDISWSDDMKRTTELYNQKYSEFLNVDKEIENIKINKASSLWDSL